MKAMDLIDRVGSAAFGSNSLDSDVTVIDNTTGQEFEILEVVDQHEPKRITLRIMGPIG